MAPRNLLPASRPARRAWAWGLAFLSLAAAAPARPQPMKIRLLIDSEIATATLQDSATARDFAALLPLSLTLTDYALVERIAQLPRKLSVAGVPAGVAPQAGDIAYYAPWGNLALFVGGGGAHAQGLVRLGRLETGLPMLGRPGPYQVRIERVAD